MLIALSLGLRPRESGQLSTINPHNHGKATRKMVPITGERAHCLKYFVCMIRGLRYQKQNRMEEETEPQT